MPSVNFFTPVYFDKGHKTFEFFENYFYLSGKKAHVIDEKSNLVEIFKKNELPKKQKSSALKNAVKIISYCTLLLPLVMLIGKAIARSFYGFQIKNASSQLGFASNGERLDPLPEINLSKTQGLRSKQALINNQIGTLKETYNADRLQSLKEKITVLLDDDSHLAEQYIQDKDIIGEDVINHDVFLSDEREQLILTHVEHSRKDLEKLKKNLKKDLPASDELVKLMHPEFRHLPKLTDIEYNKIINEAYVQAELKQKKIIKSGSGERFILRYLGYDDLKGYDDKELSLAAMSNIMKTLIARIDVKYRPQKEFKELLQQQMFTYRLQTAKVPAKLHEKMQFLISMIKEFRERQVKDYVDQNNSIASKDPVKFQQKLPKSWNRLVSSKRSKKLFYLNNALAQFVSEEIKPHINESYEYLEKIFQNKTFELPSDEVIDQKLQSKVELFELYLDDRIKVVEYTQGEEGDSSVLGDGVCTGISFEVDRKLINDPKKSLDQLELNEITSLDRFAQITHHMDRLIEKKQFRSLTFPEKFLKKFGLKDRTKLRAFFNRGNKKISSLVELFVRGIIDSFAQFQKKNPAAQVTYSLKNGDGHAVYIRFDEKEKRYLFCDPNLPVAELSGIEPDEGMFFLKNMLSKSVEVLYSDIEWMSYCNLTKL